MRKNVPAVLSVLLFSLAIAGCNSDPTTSELVDIQLTADPAQTSTSQSVDFSLAASTSSFTITSSRIDFEGDGTWDEVTPHGSSTVSASYSHRYDAEGRYSARAEVLEGLEVLDSDQVTVDVSDLGLRLVLQDLDNPPVTVDVGSQGGCMMLIPYWTARIENVPSDPQAPLPDWVRMNWVEMEYVWPDGGTTPSTYSHPIGGIVLSGETGEVSFNPIDCCNDDRLGLTAQVKLTFIGQIEDTTEIRMIANSELQLEACP